MPPGRLAQQWPACRPALCLIAPAGVLGTATAALGAYDTTALVPLPADNATAAQVLTFGRHDRTPILIDVAL